MYGLLLTMALQATAAPSPNAAPTCVCDRQCAAMWTEAASALERYTGMRLRTVTEFRLESYTPRGAGVYGMAERRPVEDGRTEVRATFVPVPDTRSVRDLAVSATRAFNASVESAGKRAECPAVSPAS